MAQNFLEYCKELDSQHVVARTMMFENAEDVAVMSLVATETLGVITIVNSRLDHPEIMEFNKLADAERVFEGVIEKSYQHGWKEKK